MPPARPREKTVGEHRRAASWWRRSRDYRRLAREYADLARAYRELQTEHAALLADTVDAVAVPEPLPGRYTVPSWAVTEEIPVITEVPPLDPDKATALIRNTGLLQQPGFGTG